MRTPTPSPARVGTRRAAATCLSAALALLVGACGVKDQETRAREVFEKIKEQMPNQEQIALHQQADPAVVKKVQEQLTKLHEYMGEVNGQIDSVTVNSIQAFQRSRDLTADGILDRRTIDALAEATSGKG